MRISERPVALPRALPVPSTTGVPGVTPPLALASFYLAGGLLTLASLAMPGWDEVLDAQGVLTVGLAAVVSGGAVLLLRERLHEASQHVLVALGSLLVGAAMVTGAGSPATHAFASFFTFVAVYAALFFSFRGAVAQIVWGAVVHAVALQTVGTQGAVASTLVRFGTVGGTALIVGGLVRQVRRAAATDPLTGLPNRRVFDEQVAGALARAERSERPVALLALDLDGFKGVNDRHGHAAGDRMLVDVGAAWEAALRGGDLLARSGGDEFVVLLPDSDEPTARRVARRLQQVTPQPLGVSVGLAVAAAGESADSLLRRADADLYRVKARRHRTGDPRIVLGTDRPASTGPVRAGR